MATHTSDAQTGASLLDGKMSGARSPRETQRKANVAAFVTGFLSPANVALGGVSRCRHQLKHRNDRAVFSPNQMLDRRDDVGH